MVLVVAVGRSVFAGRSAWVSYSLVPVSNLVFYAQSTLRPLNHYGHRYQTRPLGCKYCRAELISSLILYRLDYGNSTLSGLPLFSLNRLQRVLNNAARPVLRKRKSDYVTPLLEKLHWLPVETRIHYKIATLAFRLLKNIFLCTFQNCFTLTNPLELFDPVLKNCWKSPKLTPNLLETDLSTFKQL